MENEEMPASNSMQDDRLNERIPYTEKSLEEDLIRFIPRNQKAKRAVHSLVAYIDQGYMQEHHAEFFRKARPEPEDEFDPGYFRICANSSTVSDYLEYWLGRGLQGTRGTLRGVDILITVPGTRTANEMEGDAQVRIYIHKYSARFMIQAEAKIELDDEVVRAKKRRALNLSKTLISINEMDYWIVFPALEAAVERAYLSARNDELEEDGLPLPWITKSAFPRMCDTRLRTAVFRHRAHQSFMGIWFEGFDPTSGDLRLFKRNGVTSLPQLNDTGRRLDAWLSLRGNCGIGKIEEICTLQGDHQFDRSEILFEYYIVQEGGLILPEFTAFLKRSGANGMEWAVWKAILRQLLTGLVILHDKRWQHRTIMPNAIIVLPLQQYRAVFCDLEYMSLGEPDNFRMSQDQISHYPPEIYMNGPAAFTSKADMWMLGKTLIQQCFQKELQGVDLRNSNDHRRLMRTTTEQEMPFFRLLLKMIAWNPVDRPSAAAALTVKCLSGGSGMIIESNKRRATEDVLVEEEENQPNKRTKI